MTYYYVLFALSVFLMLVYVFKWKKSFDVCLTLVFTFIPIANMGYVALAGSKHIEQALLGNQIIYLGCCFLQLIFTLLIMNMCKVDVKKWVMVGLFCIEIFIFWCVITVKDNRWFYKKVYLVQEAGVSFIKKDYGPIHTLFYISLILYAVAGIAILVYSLKKKNISYKNVVLLLVMEVCNVIAFFVGRMISQAYEAVPVSYVIDEILLLIIVNRISVYDVDSTAIDILVQGKNLGYFSFDLKRHFLGCNDVVLEFFPEFATLRIDRRMADNEEIFERVNAWIDLVEKSKGYQEFQVEWNSKSFKVTAGYLYDGNRVKGYQILVLDETKERKYVRLLNQYNEQLRIEKSRADEASNAKSQFLANMSHEIRTPINGILGMDAILMKECKDESLIEYIKNIQSASQSLLSIVNDILDISKIESGKMELMPVKYELFSVLNDCYNMAQVRVLNKPVELKMEIQQDVPAILFGDEVRVRQIINNLLSNGAKYTQEGTVTLCMSSQVINDEEIILSITVKDTGIGIKPEDQAKLFESFTRVDEKRNRNIEGTGLGLNLTKNLVEMMGGNISLESTYGIGSSFTVNIVQGFEGTEIIGDFSKRYEKYIHVSDANEEKLYAPDAHVLIVDDVELNLKVMKGLLKDTGIKVDMATSGQQCLGLVKKNRYDMIFLDHMMPHMDGIETFMQLKEMVEWESNKCPVIMLTANALTGARDEYLTQGFDDYLSKPVLENKLKEMLAKYLPQNLQHQEAAFGITDDNQQNDEDIISKIKKETDLDVDLGLEYCMNNASNYNEILKSYVEEEASEKLDKMFNEKDWENYSIVVHSLKSTSLIIGAKDLSEKAKKLELASKSKDEEYIITNHENLMHQYKNLILNLRRMQNGEDDDNV